MILGVIPVRGGSKGVPRKNIRPLHGKPLLAWTIEAAESSELLDDYVVSTEDSEIAQVANNRGAAYKNLGQYATAISDYNKAIQLDGNNDALAYNNRSISYRALGQSTLADADKAKACSLDNRWCSNNVVTPTAAPTPAPTLRPTPIPTPTAMPLPIPTPILDSAVGYRGFRLTISPSTAVPGQEVALIGTGASYNGNISQISVGYISIDSLSNGNQVSSISTDSSGNFSASLVIPNTSVTRTPGSYTIRVSDNGGDFGEVTLRIPSRIVSMSTDSSSRGSTVTMAGSGFFSNDYLQVYYLQV